MKKVISPSREIVNQLIKDRIEYISKGMRILEIECGTVDTFKKMVENKYHYSNSFLRRVF